jgi:CubicO group peptidase (beta-lactamase class C family)
MKTLFGPKFILITIMLLIAGSWNLNAQVTSRLPRSTPENEGVSTEGILDFLTAVDSGNVELHSFMFIRHGKVIAEGWWSPYGPDYKHIMFSASKTFTATAIGLAQNEGFLKITDRIVSYFPSSLPDTLSDYMKGMTIENLLTMSVGQDPAPMPFGTTDWIKDFLALVPVYQPGTVFKYNNMATVILSAVLQEATGQTVFDFLKPRIFNPLSIRGIDWENSPGGYNMGATGLRLRTEDMAKFGQLLLQGGMWNGKQLIPKEWVATATSFKIQSNDPGNPRLKANNDWEWGYCYQMWRGRNNTVRLDGAAGQFVVLIPDKDAIVVMTGGTTFSQLQLDLVHNYLIPAIRSDKPLPADEQLYSTLQQKEKGLILKPASAATVRSEMESKISGKEFMLGNNDLAMQSVYFTFNNAVCDMAIKRNGNITVLKAGADNWKMTNADLSFLIVPSLPGIVRTIDANYTVPLSTVRVGARYRWTDGNTLEIIARPVEESIGSRVYTLKFSDTGRTITLTMQERIEGMAMPFETPREVRISGTIVQL